MLGVHEHRVVAELCAQDVEVVKHMDEFVVWQGHDREKRRRRVVRAFGKGRCKRPRGGGRAVDDDVSEEDGGMGDVCEDADSVSDNESDASRVATSDGELDALDLIGEVDGLPDIYGQGDAPPDVSPFAEPLD